MSEHDIVTVGRTLPKLASVEPANGPFSVSVTWAAGARVGRTDIVDLAPMIHTFKVFRALRDGTVPFNSVCLGDWGASIVWEGNDDLDIGADSIEEMADEVMTNADFSAFLKRNNLTLDAAAAQLGIARRLVAYYAKEREIPRTVALACRYLDITLGNAAGPTVEDLVEAAGLCSAGMTGEEFVIPIPLGGKFDDAKRYVWLATKGGSFRTAVDRGVLMVDRRQGSTGVVTTWAAGDPLPPDFFPLVKSEKRGE